MYWFLLVSFRYHFVIIIYINFPLSSVDFFSCLITFSFFSYSLFFILHSSSFSLLFYSSLLHCLLFFFCYSFTFLRIAFLLGWIHIFFISFFLVFLWISLFVSHSFSFSFVIPTLPLASFSFTSPYVLPLSLSFSFSFVTPLILFASFSFPFSVVYSLVFFNSLRFLFVIPLFFISRGIPFTTCRHDVVLSFLQPSHTRTLDPFTSMTRQNRFLAYVLEQTHAASRSTL